MIKQEISHALRSLPEHVAAAIKNACPMVESTWTGVCVFIASLALRFHWQIVGKSHFGKRISLQAQGLFRIRRNPAMAYKKHFYHTQNPRLFCHCEPVRTLAWQSFLRWGFPRSRCSLGMTTLFLLGVL